MICSNDRRPKALIRLGGCAGWSAPFVVSKSPKTCFLALRPICVICSHYLNNHAQLATCCLTGLIFGLNFNRLPYFVCISSEGSCKTAYLCRLISLLPSYNRVPTGQGKVRENCFFFTVREMSGNSVKWSGKLENLQKSGKSQGILKSCLVHPTKIEQTDMS